MPFSLLKKTSQKKRADPDELNDHFELEELEVRAAEQFDIIQNFQDKLESAEETVCFTKMSNSTLSKTVKELQKLLNDKENLQKQHASKNLRLRRDILKLQIDLSIKMKKSREIKDLEEKLDLSLAIREQFIGEYESKLQVWNDFKTQHMSDINNMTVKYDDVKQQVVEYDKVISKMRVDRNQREALVNKLQKDLEKVENKRNEVEIETRNAKKLLAEAKQNHMKLEEEVVLLRKAKKDLLSKVDLFDAYKGTEKEKKRSEAMKLQLQQLCSHIQESEKKYKETMSRFQSRLMIKDEVNFNSGVLAPAKEVLKNREEPHSSSKL